MLKQFLFFLLFTSLSLIACGPANLQTDGGLRFILEVHQYSGAQEKCVEILKKRLELCGIKGYTVIRGTGNEIVIELPGKMDKERIRKLITISSNIEFAE